MTMLRPDYPIRTARLTVRPFTPSDLEDLCAIRSRDDVTRYLYAEPETPEQVKEVLERKIGEVTLDAVGKTVSLAVVWPQLDRVIGEVHLQWLSGEHRQGEIGFVINPEYHGNGFATEAAEVVLRLGFAGLGLHRIIGRLDSRNVGSARVLEKLGMRREAHFRHDEIFKGEWSDQLVYAMLDDEWQSRG
ncbi:GNAT family N-acetyltransferase [Kribbella shirazensis]|uniref:RimJ/RimL family protein N-acetyltransferase n=1 Tax=Kribbella shirazensis TaxID=1105143 RepID=A0A7X5V833_9ACTN|nr:GNAT family N-acetyltransferase [Kribbella shirazensis]NIK56370.1 RimJ/RimL family protein N-acetyltransferase [Kribbella shirazensis]